MSQGKQAAIGCLSCLALLVVGTFAVLFLCGGLGFVALEEAAESRLEYESRPKADLATQQERKALIDRYMEVGLVTKIDSPAGAPHVYVDPVAWKLADHEDKVALAGVVAAYYYSIPKGNAGDVRDMVIFRDRTTAARIASFTPGPTGLSE